MIEGCRGLSSQDIPALVEPPKMCKIMTFWAILGVFGLSFYIQAGVSAALILFCRFFLV